MKSYKKEYVRLSDLGQIVTGKTPPTDTESYYNGEYPFITPTDIKTYDVKYIEKTDRSLSDLGADFQKKLILPKNSICFVCIGSTIGKMCMTNRDSFSNQQINTIIPNNKVNPEYLFYFLRYIRSYFQSIGGGTGSGKSIVNKTTFSNSKVEYISELNIQKRIANLLSKYDSLIESNNKRIKILEQMAEELYKEWFVRFRFPDFKTSEFENGIPKGWERKKIYEYYNTTSGGTPSRSHSEYYENGVYPWVKTGEIKDSIILDTEEHITDDAIKKSSAKLLPKNSIIMAMYGVNIGMLSYLNDSMTCNQACCVFVEKRDFSSRHYLFYTLKSIREYLLLIGFGAAQQNLSQDLIKNIRIVMPDDSLIRLFENKVEKIYDSICNALKENSNLIKQRDLLLPRLMSGKLEV